MTKIEIRLGQVVYSSIAIPVFVADYFGGVIEGKVWRFILAKIIRRLFGVTLKEMAFDKRPGGGYNCRALMVG